jgi:hypothetical protein
MEGPFRGAWPEHDNAVRPFTPLDPFTSAPTVSVDPSSTIYTWLSALFFSLVLGSRTQRTVALICLYYFDSVACYFLYKVKALSPPLQTCFLLLLFI